jgi:hypothetical protein
MQIIAEDGRRIATVLAAASEPNGVDIELKRFADGKGELLRYYFINGGRNVRLVNGDVVLAGTLHTHWTNSRRSWSITLTPRIAPAPIVGRAPARSGIEAR